MICGMVADVNSVADLDAWLGERFCIVEGEPKSTCTTGQAYITIRHDMIDAEGRECEILATSAEIAERMLVHNIIAFATGKSGTLHWRTRPQVDSRSGYSRLAIVT